MLIGLTVQHSSEMFALGRTRTRSAAGLIPTLLVLGGIVAGCGGPGPAPPVVSHWTTSIFPGDSSLSGVSCTSTKWCMGVGVALPSNDTDGSAIWARYSNRSWTFRADIRVNKEVGLNAVTCFTSSDCMAVGQEITTVQRCAYGACTPTDSTTSNAYFGPIVETWNGSAWVTRGVPAPPGAESGYYRGIFNGISCSSRKFCIAVGYFRNALGEDQPLAERWDGRIWRLTRMPMKSGLTAADLDAVSCYKTECTAVGNSVRPNSETTPFAESWNGARWVQSSTSDISGSLTADTCSSSQDCMAVGSAGVSGLLEQWNGTRWTTLPMLTAPMATIGLTGISCTTSSCVAVGWEQRARATEGLSATWGGQSWTILPIAKGTGDSPKGLSAVSCPSDDLCVAVGGLGTGLASLGQPAIGGSFRF